MIHERNNDIAEEQQALARAGVRHIGELVRGNTKLLGKNLPVALRLVQHVDKIAVFKNVLDLTRG